MYVFESNDSPFWGVEATGFEKPQDIATQIELNKFKPRDYQEPIYDAFFKDRFKRLVLVICRRAGKDLLTWNIVIREAITNPGVYYVVYPTYSQGKKILWNSVTNDGKRFLDYIPKSLISSINGQEMRINLLNGSFIQIIGSDSPDRIVGTNPRGVVFSEYALQNPMIWARMSPILTANGGWAIFQSCVSPNTIVITENGFNRIKNISSSRTEYSDLNKPIFGLGGFNNATDFYFGGKQKTLKITLASGYSIECTHIHPLWNGAAWVKAKDIKVGSLLPVQYGQNVFGRGLGISGFKNSEHRDATRPILKETVTDDFLYLLGLIHADGSYFKTQVTVTNKKDPEVIEFIKQFGFKTQIDGIHHSLSSVNFGRFLEYIGFKHGAKNKIFPDKLFECTREQLKSFLQGVFDGDGTSNSNPLKRGYVKLTSTCELFIKDLQVVLLNFGIASSYRKEEKEPTKKVPVHSTIYNLEITGYFANIFYEEIGFRLERKQRNKMYLPETVKKESGNICPVNVTKLSFKPPKHTVTNPSKMSRRMILKLIEKYDCKYLKSLVKEKLFFSPVKSIEESYSEVFDFVIPSTHSFFSDGLISHNTPRGHNHFYELYELARTSPDWWSCKLGLNETKHVPVSEIQREISEGLMSEDLVQQEWYSSFDSGVEGSIFAKYIDRMNLNNQITTVPWESHYPVHTAWDLGMSDPTCVIFFQVVGQIIKIIDYYDKRLEGLEHYALYLQSKPYKYGTHIAPFDIMVKEQTTGMTRKEKAAQLGIDFKIAPSPKKVTRWDGIESVRAILGKVWIDETRCAKLIKAMENYQREFNAKLNTYREVPLHNWACHGCDALRYAAITLPDLGRKTTPEDLKQAFHDAVASGSNLPPQFQTTKEHVFSNPIVNEW